MSDEMAFTVTDDNHSVVFICGGELVAGPHTTPCSYDHTVITTVDVPAEWWEKVKGLYEGSQV